MPPISKRAFAAVPRVNQRSGRREPSTHSTWAERCRTLDQITGPVDLGQGLISRSGWSVVDDSKKPVLTSDWVQTRPNQSELDWYLFGYGLDYKGALRSLASVSGPVPLPRKNLLGIWYSRYWPYTSKEFREIVQQYTDHHFPLDNIVMDMDWHITQVPGVKRDYAGQVWTGYTWDRKLLPDAEELLKWFHQQGLHVTLNDHPADGVQPHEQMYADFMRAMGADPASKQKLPFDAGNKKYMDTFWQYTHRPAGERRRGFLVAGLAAIPLHALRARPDQSALAQSLLLRTHRRRQASAACPSAAGPAGATTAIRSISPAMPAPAWPMLAFEVPFTSTAGNVGCFFWSHDIGGHMGGRNEESYTRWCQFGAMSAALRSHSTRNAEMDRRPWAYPNWAEDSMRVSFHLRSELFPYIYTSAGRKLFPGSFR